MKTLIEKNSVVLFQGDSITNTGRDHNNFASLGQGYAMIAAALFKAKYPELNVTFINKGISGNRVVDLKERWQEDCIDLKPNWVSVLIGINDTWKRYDRNSITTAQEYEQVYREILNRVKNETNARLIIGEPFLLHATKEMEAWREDLDPKIQVARKLAKEFNAIYIPYDGLFATANAKAESSFWAYDGVHPTYAGHALIASAWLDAIKY